MKKTATSLHYKKLPNVHLKHQNQPYTKQIATFQLPIPSNIRNHLTPCKQEVFEQACSTTFTSKIFQFSNCESQGPSNAISPSKNQTQIPQKKKKINVTASSIKMKTQTSSSLKMKNQTSSSINIKTQTSEPKNQKPKSSILAFTEKKRLNNNNQKQASTNSKNQNYVIPVNPQQVIGQKQQLLKKLGGKKPSETKYSCIYEFLPKQNQKIYTQTAEIIQTKHQKNFAQDKLQLKQNLAIMRSEKKINLMKKRNLQLETEGNQAGNSIQKIKTENDGIWIVLRQNTDLSYLLNIKEVVETPINKLMDEEQELFFKKPKLFCEK